MAQSAARKRVGTSRRTAVVELEPVPTGDELTPIYAAALLKISMELKRPDARGLDDLLAQVLEGLRIDPAEFRAYLSRNFSLLQATARNRGY
jgi:hypothetical protein